jgi:hypothetical protein
VIDDGECLFRMTNLAAGEAKTFKSLRAGHFMDKMAIDVEKTCAVLLTIDQMVIPYLVIECAWHCHCDILGYVVIHAMAACNWRFSPLPVLMNPEVHSAPALENPHFRLALT